MVYWTVAASGFIADALPYRFGRISFGLLDRVRRVQPLSQKRGDGGRQGAAGAVGVNSSDKRRGQQQFSVSIPEDVDGLLEFRKEDTHMGQAVGFHQAPVGRDVKVTLMTSVVQTSMTSMLFYRYYLTI